MQEDGAESWKEGQVKEKVILSPQYQSVFVSWKEGARVDGVMMVQWIFTYIANSF